MLTTLRACGGGGRAAQFLEGNSRKNELYVAKYISFFQSQVGPSARVPPP